jgi:cystathionine beta-lyase
MAEDTATARDGFAAFDRISVDELRQRKTAKWSYYGEDVLAAWVAEMDFPLAPVVRTALHEAIDRGCAGYPPLPEHFGLPAAVTGWLRRNTGFEVDPGRVRILPDTLRGMRLAIETFSAPDRSVVILTPSYPPFFEVARTAGRQVIEVPMIKGAGQLTFDLDGIGAALRAGASTVLLCNPHNPLGRVFTRRELGALAAVVQEHGARVVSDELHAPLVYPDSVYTPYASVSTEAAGHSVTLLSASKGWNLAGLKCAELLLTNEADLEPWSRLHFLQTSGASILGMVANAAAFEAGDAWRSELVNYLDGNRRLLGDLLTEHLPQVGYTMPQATYLAWLDCTALGQEKPADFFLKRAKVALTEGAPFGAPGQGFARLNFAAPRALLTDIVKRMAAAIP